ncbi:unnamed protein product [Rotaria sp. Silwood1]|nr:unnamed protein product [Rotaria sp. Silwood1]CAF1181852.1 unnamed protein product [Rotaria sp. Silwood1]CAF3457253.1 unnamed protein product [Rotaria sp. Silwood1]CAF4842067.1 unnamed protein product [Rotaria sp. Silwood1]
MAMSSFRSGFDEISENCRSESNQNDTTTSPTPKFKPQVIRGLVVFHDPDLNDLDESRTLPCYLFRGHLFRLTYDSDDDDNHDPDYDDRPDPDHNNDFDPDYNDRHGSDHDHGCDLDYDNSGDGDCHDLDHDHSCDPDYDHSCDPDYDNGDRRDPGHDDGGDDASSHILDISCAASHAWSKMDASSHVFDIYDDVFHA